MGIEVGQTLDKYELLEKVGQGGMAIVYRGRDTALRREVAVKVLHHHLADHAEARDRFEREAQAVAKLRHANILEIFDYSGKGSAASYIVTEFIAGQTLKQFITDHDIRFPEIGAMIAVQVGRALAHAHLLGVLHRDVKPENIMIRNDGVVKLTDFGIAQMLDVQRLTMTGQLLGSPAYMSPEHVEGQPLDVRTDVFAVGIVLYQLVTGDLPFKGRNAHEILKKIAEGRFADPALVNPLVGSRLAAILRRALAREKHDRYDDVSQLVAALEGYLAEGGLVDCPAELGRFFAAPVSYETALAPRLTAALAAAGRARLADDRNAALELFNRVLTIDPGNRDVVREIERMSRRSRAVKLLAVVGVAAVAAGGAAWLRSRPATAADDGRRTTAASAARGVPVGGATESEPREATPVGDGEVGGGMESASVAPGPASKEERSGAGTDGGGRNGREGRGTARGAARDDDERDGEGEAGQRLVTLVVSPRGSEVSVDGAAWRTLAGVREQLALPAARAALRFRNPGCCIEQERVVEPGQTGDVRVELAFVPGSVTPRCARPGVTATLDGRAWTLGEPATIPIASVTGRDTVTVRFTDGRDYLDEQAVAVRFAETRDVVCAD